MKAEGFKDPRGPSLQELIQFLENTDHRSGLVYLRGRRRVGKSTVLQSFSQQKKYNLFYFSGVLDETNQQTRLRFAKAWADYSGNNIIQKIKLKELTWDFIWKDIATAAVSKKINLVFDEIQWIAKGQSGFIGTLKNYWLNLEPTQNCRIIICGSSNKFFKTYTGGEEQILRGIKTHSDIILPPFSLSEVHKQYGQKLKPEQTSLLYMILGGIPYYWNQLYFDLSFIQLLNKAFAIKNNIFLEEVDEVLRLEFNQAGLKTIKKILRTISLKGNTLDSIQSKSKLATGTLVDSINKLCEYNILFEESSVYGKQLEIKRGSKFFMKDFYLNFYFSLIKPNETKIRRNEESLLINELFKWPTSFYYIEGFSGEAFENLIEYTLQSSYHRNQKIFNLLKLKNVDFEIGKYWSKDNQIDLVIHNCSDQQDRWIECKWTNSIDLIRQQALSLVNKKNLFISNKNTKSLPQLFLAIPIVASKELIKFCKDLDITIIEITDLF